MAHISRRATLRVWLQERDARRVWVQDTLFVASAPSALSDPAFVDMLRSPRHSPMPRRLPIHEAARYWDVDQIQELISKGVNPDALDEPGGRTPLFFACCEESNLTAALSNDEGHADAQVACATALLRAGASAKAANVYGLGPIHCAAACRRAGARLVELLIVYGADPNQSTGGGRTPLHAAAQHGHAATVHALLRAGADANFRGRYGTALDLANCPPKITARAHRTRCRRVLPYLLRAGADQYTNQISRRFATHGFFCAQARICRRSRSSSTCRRSWSSGASRPTSPSTSRRSPRSSSRSSPAYPKKLCASCSRSGRTSASTEPPLLRR